MAREKQVQEYQWDFLADDIPPEQLRAIRQ